MRKVTVEEAKDVKRFISEVRENKGNSVISLSENAFKYFIPGNIHWIDGSSKCNIEILNDSNNMNNGLVAFEFEFQNSEMTIDLWLGKEWLKYKGHLSLFLDDIEAKLNEL